tara:strand:+ start:8327 stop:8686 length:360 start_codon:yes stop_codon:yes gene_type:complete
MANGRNSKGHFIKGNTISKGKGRPPKGSAWSDVLNELLDSSTLDVGMTFPDGNHKRVKLDIDGEKTFRMAVGVALITKAIKGDVSAIRELCDRTEGKPSQKIESTTIELPNGFELSEIE